MDDEPINPLDGPAPIERVINGDEVKLYRTRVLLAYLDGDVFDFEKTALHFGTDGPIPVRSDDGQVIGFASVFYTHGRFEADISIDYSSPERLSIETGDSVWPRIYGTMAMAPQLVFDFQAKLQPKTLRLDGIVLSPVAPADKRLPPVGARFLSREEEVCQR